MSVVTTTPPIAAMPSEEAAKEVAAAAVRPVQLHPLTFLADGDEVVVGRPDIDVYGVFPPDGAELVRELLAGRCRADAAAWYEARFGESVDLDDFVSTLAELGFVREDSPPDGPAAAGSVRGRRLGRMLFSAPVAVAFAAVVAAVGLACWSDPRLVPRPEHVLFSDYLVAVELTMVFGQIPLVALHEVAHLLAGRRLGLRSRIGIGRRLYFVVFETHLDGLVAIPRRQRYLPMIAGMLTDVAVVAVLTGLAALFSGGPGAPLPLASRVCLALAFGTVLRIAWQFYFFLRTDIYYLVATVCGCIDLDTTARAMVRNWFNRRLGRRHALVDPDRWHPRDRAVARWYAPMLVVGYLVSIGMLVGVVWPLAWQFAVHTWHGLAGEADADAPARYLDSLLIVGLTAAQLGLAAAIGLRQRRATTAAASEERS